MESSQKWFEELYEKHSKKMITIAVRLGFSIEEGEDIMQDAFLLLLSKADVFQEGHDSPRAFLYKTHRNLIGDKLRQRKRWKYIPYDELQESPTQDTYFPLLKDNLLSGLNKLDKALLIAHYEERATYAELSKRFGISEGQCRVKVFRAKARYQKILLNNS